MWAPARAPVPVVLAAGVLALAGCGAAGGAREPEPSVRFSRPLEIYRDLALITGTADFPAVATVTTLAGPGDSTLVLFGLSLPPSVLRFRRDDGAFAATYRVSLRAARDSVLAASVDREATVRVATFDETSGTDETVLFQTRMTVPPGEYTLTTRVRDGVSARGFERSDTLAAPAYRPGGAVLAGPVLTHRAAPRTDRAGPPELILNARHTVPYGGDAPVVYMEAYGAESAELTVRDARGDAIWSRSVVMDPGAGLAAGVVAIPTDSLPMGRFALTAVTAGDTVGPVPLLVTLTDDWVVANFSEAMGLLRYIAPAEQLEALRDASPAERRRLWDAFWEERDPVPATPANEYRDAVFERIRVATIQFSEPGRPGWRTDRGEVYIVLGPPTRITDLRYDDAYTGRSSGQEWVYHRAPGGGRLSLVFLDRRGLGTYELSPDSEAAFRAIAQRLKLRPR